MKATSSQSNKRGVSLATLAFVAMLMIGQTAPMEYIRDSTYHQETVSYDTVGLSVAENSQSDVVIDLMSTVSGADGCKMSVLDGQGDDSALFTSPVNGVASFDATMASTAFDYENPLDADGDNTFEFDVRTVCPGNVASSETYYVNVTNTVFGFYGDATASITEDVAANMSVWSPTMMNDTTANCAITAGDDAGNFDINASTCAITVSETASFDHETSPTITLTVAASTAGDLESATQDVAVSVTDVNEAPVGAIGIAGTLTEGETLTADLTGLTDEDGIMLSSAASGIITNIEVLVYDGSTGDATYDGLSYIQVTHTEIASTSGYTIDTDRWNGTAWVDYDAAGLGDGSTVSEIQVWPWFVPNDPVSSSDYYRVTITDSGTSHTAYYDTCGYSAYERGSSMMDTYQWYRSGTAITGATCDAYTLTNDDATQTIQVSMTYADTAGRQTTVLSAASAIVTDVDNNAPTSTAIPNQAVLEDATTTIDVSGYFSDDDPGAVLSYAISGATFATINSTGVISASPAQGDVTHTAAGAIQLTEQTVQTATVTSTNETGVTTTLCTLSVLGGVAASDTCSATVPTGSTGEVVWTTTTSTASMVILDATSTEVYNSASAGTFALAAGTYDLTMTESNPLADTFATNQVTVTVTDQDGTATSQTFHMNVTNVNDAFSLGSYSLSIAGDVHDGATMTPGYADTVTTTLCISITNPPGSSWALCPGSVHPSFGGITVPAGVTATMTFGDTTIYQSEFTLAVYSSTVSVIAHMERQTAQPRCPPVTTSYR